MHGVGEEEGWVSSPLWRLPQPECSDKVGLIPLPRADDYLCHAQVLGRGVDKLFLYTLISTFIQKRTEHGNQVSSLLRMLLSMRNDT